MHGMIEHQLPEFKADPPHAYKAPGKQVVPKTVADFLDFRVRLLGATELVKTHFHRLVEVQCFAHIHNPGESDEYPSLWVFSSLT